MTETWRILPELGEGEPIAAHDGAPRLVRDARGWHLRLDRPAEHNRLDPADVDALTDLFATLTANNAPPSIVISGTGGRSFSSGYTLSAITEQLDDRFETMLDTLEGLPCLTIAALNGGVYGGATDLALCCDIRLGDHEMRMFMPAARIGLHYYPGGLRRYVTRLGLTAASKLMLTSMTVQADELLRIGFLTELLAARSLAARVAEYRDAAAANAAPVVARMKAHMQAIAHGLAADDPRYEIMRADYAASTQSHDLRERLAATLKKR
ncbi:MAG: enoyl-CoA hydratase/isomerase family protein [Burkholderiaceae bacterium]